MKVKIGLQMRINQIETKKGHNNGVYLFVNVNMWES